MSEGTNRESLPKENQTQLPESSTFFVRHVIDNGIHYLSIVDVLFYLEVSNAPSSYWSKMKRRTSQVDRGFHEAVAKVKVFPLKAQDGKARNTECFDEETLLRILQSIPGQSQKLEDIKLLMAHLTADHIHQPQTPEEAIEEKRQAYIAMGYSPDWATTRAQGEIIRNTLTEIQGARGAEGRDYAVLTNIMMRKVFGMPVQTYMTFKSLPRGANLRDHMSRGALGVTAYTEALIGELHETRDTYGIDGLSHDVEDASEEGRKARLNAEKLLQRPIDTPQNYLHLTESKKLRGKKHQTKTLGTPSSPLLDENDTTRL